MISLDFKRPDWFFYPAWVGVGIVTVPVSWSASFLVIGAVTRGVGQTILVNGQTRFTEDVLFLYIFSPMLCLLSGILQYILLRLYVSKMGGWVLATMAGCLLAFVNLTFMQRISASNFLTIWNGALAFATIGGTFGFSQWVLLRQRIPRASLWILASTLGGGLAVLGRLIAEVSGSALVQLYSAILPPALVASLAWWNLLKPQAKY